jgi:hypothetical protein
MAFYKADYFYYILLYKEQPMSNDWIPSREGDLVDLAGQKWAPWLVDTGKQTAYAWDTVDCASLTAKITEFITRRNSYHTDNSSEKRIAKDDAKEMTIDAMRDFARQFVRFNKRMPKDAKMFMGMPADDKPSSPHNTPSSQPDTDVLPTTNHYEHKVRALNHGTGSTSKPEDAYGVRFGWQRGGDRPASGGDLPKSKFSRRTTVTVTHTEADKGQTVYYATCYENSKGEMGPWSPITEAIIA